MRHSSAQRGANTHKNTATMNAETFSLFYLMDLHGTLAIHGIFHYKLGYS